MRHEARDMAASKPRRSSSPRRARLVSTVLLDVRAEPEPGRLELRLKAERETGVRFFLEVRAGMDLAQARAEARALLGREARVAVDRKGKGGATSWLIATLPGRRVSDAGPNVFDVAHALRDDSGGTFVRVEPDPPQEPKVEESCPGKGKLCFDDPDGPADRYWHLREMKVPEAWGIAPSRGNGVRIGHVDTGYTDHPEMAGCYDFARDKDFIGDDADARDPLVKRGNPGHGTKTGSVLASRHPGPLPALGSGPVGLAGVAPDATIVPIRSIRSVMILFNGDVARGIDHAVDSECHVISLSLGGVGGRRLKRSVKDAVAANLIVCAAAGNCTGTWVVEPASFWNCIAVAGTKSGGAPWKGSAHGKAVEVSAPAHQVWVAAWCPKDKAFAIVPGQGTSFSVAAVAGVAALWLAHHGREALLARYGNHVELQWVFMKLLTETAWGGPPGDGYGSGIVDAERLLQAALPSPQSVLGFRDQRRKHFDSFAGPSAPHALRLGRREAPIEEMAADLLPLATLPTAEAELLDLELRQILHDHPNARQALVNGLRWRKAGAAPAAAEDMQAEMDGIGKYASERLQRLLR